MIMDPEPEDDITLEKIVTQIKAAYSKMVSFLGNEPIKLEMNEDTFDIICNLVNKEIGFDPNLDYLCELFEVENIEINDNMPIDFLEEE